MIPWSLDDRAVCALLMAVGGLLLALPFSSRTARIAWPVLLAAGMVNALVLSLNPRNLVNINVVHHYLGAKYAIPYPDFYRAVNAALGRPQVLMRDLEHPPAMFREDARARRAYFIDLLRENGTAFDPLSPLDSLQRRALETGAVASEADRILRAELPADRIEDFRRDVRASVPALGWNRDITTDYGFNGSPFYALTRRIDPTLRSPFSPTVSRLNLAWQLASLLAVAWLVGGGLGLALTQRIAGAALVLASWDFAGYALPGLVTAGLWLPVAAALFALRRRRFALAGGATAWAGLVKVFPLVLALPALVDGVAGARKERPRFLGRRGWIWFLAGLIATLVVLGPLSAVTGRSWAGFLEKIVAQFQSGGYLMNSVSAGMGLLTLGIRETALPRIVSIFSLLILAGLFAGNRDPQPTEALPRRSLLLLASMGWVVQTWFNYYALAPLFLLPWLSRRHPRLAAAGAFLLAASFLLPDFDDPLLREAPFLHVLKVFPYLALPALLVGVEYRSIPVPPRTRRILVGTIALLGLAVAAEGWRAHAVDGLVRAGETELDRGHPAAALVLLERASLLSPGNAVARMDAGIALVALGRGPEAGAAFAQATGKAPEDRTIRQNYGLWLLGAGRLAAASRELEMARRLAPYDDTILMDLARVRLREGNREEAIRLLTRARELNPGHDAAGRLLEGMGH